MLSVEGVTARYGKVAACSDVSLAVPAGAVYGILGRSGAGKSSLVRCIFGEKKPAAGRVRILGRDARRQRRSLRSSLQRISTETVPGPGTTLGRLARRRLWAADRYDARALSERAERLGVPMDRPFGDLSAAGRTAALLALALSTNPRLLVLDGPDFGTDPAGRAALQREIRDAAERLGAAVLLATRQASDAEGIADRVGILDAGRLVLDEDAALLVSRFRRIRYRSEMTPSRTDYGTELDLFEAARVRVRGWGTEAIVANYTEEAFARLQGTDGVADAEESPLTLTEIFETISPPPRPGKA